MSSSVRQVPLEDAVELILDHRGRTPKKLGGDFTDSGVQVISAKNVYDGRLHHTENQRFVTTEMAQRWMPIPLQPEDVLLTSEAPLGQVAYLDTRADFCLGQRLFGLRARRGDADGRFLYYLLRSPSMQARLQARVSGTTAQGIKQSELRKVIVDLPPLKDQQSIASTLGALDDKIDSNQRLVGLLDATATELYRGLFIDFAGEVDRVDSAIGPIPADWRIAELGALGTVRGGGTPSSKVSEFWEPAEVVWVTPKDMTALRSPVVYESERMISQQGLRNSSAKLLPAGTVLYTSRATLGHVAVARRDLATNQGFIAIEPTSGYSSAFVLMTLRVRNEDIVAKANGSTFLEVNKSNFKNVPFVDPPPHTRRRFDDVAGPMYRQIEHLDRESAHLRAARDALLPRLLGQGRVSSHGASVGDVAHAVEAIVA